MCYFFWRLLFLSFLSSYSTLSMGHGKVIPKSLTRQYFVKANLFYKAAHVSRYIFAMEGYISVLPVRNIPKFKDRANWSRDTFQPMRRHACVYQQTNQNIAPVIKNFQNNGRSRTESVIVSRFSGIFLRLFMRHTQFF